MTVLAAFFICICGAVWIAGATLPQNDTVMHFEAGR